MSQQLITNFYIPGISKEFLLNYGQSKTVAKICMIKMRNIDETTLDCCMGSFMVESSTLPIRN